MKRATKVVALFFLSPTICAQPKVETSREVIEKAYSLSVQRERAQAVALLVGAIKKENKKDLLQALDEVAGVFYSDKAQQLYELAVSMKSTDLKMVTGKLTEALKLEPDNLSLLLEQMRVQIALQECVAALDQVKKQREQNPYSEALLLLQAQAGLCADKFQAYLEIKPAVDLKKSPLAAYWGAIEMEYLFKTAAYSRVKDLSIIAQKTYPGYTEPVYWLWKAEQAMKLNSEKSAQKYLNLCKNLSSRASRQYLAEPHLCRRTAEVETFLKKNNNSGI